jgi:hypothetical protein
MNFDFSKVTVKELDDALETGRFSKAVRAVIAKVSGTPLDEINAMTADKYKKVVANFVKAAYDPVAADPN